MYRHRILQTELRKSGRHGGDWEPTIPILVIKKELDDPS
jgi:hypothetical protein